MIRSIADLQSMKEAYLDKMGQYQYQCLVCFGTGCVSSKCEAIRDTLVEELEKLGLTDKVAVVETGCIGTCAVGPILYVLPDETYYTEMTPDKVRDIVRKHFAQGEPIQDYTFYDTIQKKHVSNIHDIAFFKDQVRIALRNCGLIDFKTVNSYVAKDGYLALARILEKGDRMAVIREMKESGLRGRGGAGFPTGVKWEAAYNQPGDEKYIICNADEGDPGAFMDRSVFEGDPHSVIEGMLIGGYAIGANHGVVYIRAEYPIAADRLAEELGIEDADPNRIRAGITFVLRHNEHNGHCFIPWSKLCTAAAQQLQLEQEDITSVMEDMVEQGDLVRDPIAGQDACYLPDMYRAEKETAERIAAMVQKLPEVTLNLDQLIEASPLLKEHAFLLRMAKRYGVPVPAYEKAAALFRERGWMA